MTPPDLPAAWAITGAAPLAEGIGGQVWRARRRNGEPVVLKRVSPQAASDATYATAYLDWRQGQGAVRLLAVDGRWQMLEDAGDRTLTQVLDQEGDAAATLIAAEVLRVLHAPATHRADGLQTMKDRFAALTTAAQSEGGLFAEADAWLKTLASGPVQPLHGDLHHDNILFGARGWLGIDPHGLIGDPAYDAANLLYNRWSVRTCARTRSGRGGWPRFWRRRSSARLRRFSAMASVTPASRRPGIWRTATSPRPNAA